MSHPHIEIDDRDLHARLTRIRQTVDNPEPIVRGIAREFLTLVQEEFKVGKDPEGKPWLPLKCRDGSPLRDTGRLRDSIFTRVQGSEMELATNAMAVGTNARYASTHQRGADIKARLVTKRGLLVFRVRDRWVSKYEVKIPPRPFFPETRLPATWSSGARFVVREALRLAAGEQGSGAA